MRAPGRDVQLQLRLRAKIRSAEVRVRGQIMDAIRIPVPLSGLIMVVLQVAVVCG